MHPHDSHTHARDAHSPELTGLLVDAAVHPDDAAAAHAEAHRRLRRHRLAALLVALTVLAVGAAVVSQVAFTEPGGAAAPVVAVTAETTGVLVTKPGDTAVQRAGSARPVATGTALISADAALATHSVGTNGAVAVIERATTTASMHSSAKQASAAATIERISLFDGRIEIAGAKLTSTAATRSGRATSSATLAPTTTLTVDGTVTPITTNQRIALEGIGTVLINEQAVLAAAPTGDEQTGPRARTVAAIAHVRLTAAHGDLPAGTDVVIGRVDAGIREGKVRTVAHPGAGTPLPKIAAPAGLTNLQPGTPKPGDVALPRQGTTVRSSPATRSTASLQNYTFPVLGNVSYTNDWGGARASTGIPHQGTDIFADAGTPIVATADGVLDRVGWNAIGGYRFWLFDQYGNSFYHAHLSAYAPLAQDGARVRAGDVIGFVGTTGDAQGTPPHLHFEVHPGNGAATNPFPFLNAWQRGVAVAIGLSASIEDKPAALSLQGFTDISANSGLQESVLDSVPQTSARPVEGENVPQPTAETLKQAIEGPGTSAAK